jgi:hypothetical protein
MRLVSMRIQGCRGAMRVEIHSEKCQLEPSRIVRPSLGFSGVQLLRFNTQRRIQLKVVSFVRQSKFPGGIATHAPSGGRRCLSIRLSMASVALARSRPISYRRGVEYACPSN